MNILLNGIDILGVLLGGVCVIHAQVAQTAVLLGSAKVDYQRLAVAYMQISVGLGRETGVYLHARKAAALGDILIYKILDKILAYLVHFYMLP